MPTLVASKFPKQKSEDEFEDLVTDILTRFWRTHVTRHGRRGQEQDGVDAYGEPPHLAGGIAGAQYKNVKALTIAKIRAEVTAAEGFAPALSEYLVVTSLDADVDLQRDVRLLSHERHIAGRFPLSIWFWQDIERELASHRDLVRKYYSEWQDTFAQQVAPIEPAQSRPQVNWDTFYVTVSDEGPRFNEYLMLSATPAASRLTLDGDLLELFRSEVEHAFGNLAPMPDSKRALSYAIDLGWKSPNGLGARKWRRGADGSIGFVTSVESASTRGSVSVWEVALECLLFLRFIHRVLPGQDLDLVLDFQPGSLIPCAGPLAPADVGKATLRGVPSSLRTVDASFRAATGRLSGSAPGAWYDALAHLLADRWRVMFAAHDIRIADLATALRELAESEGISITDDGARSHLIAIGPHVVASGRVTAADAGTWIVALTGFVLGDAPTLKSYVAQLPDAVTSRYVLDEESGDGRVIAGAPSWKQEHEALVVTIPVAPRATREDARQIGADVKLDETGDLLIPPEFTSGMDRVPQALSFALGLQEGEWFLNKEIGTRTSAFHGRREDRRLVERFWKLELIRLASVPGSDGALQVSFVARVNDLRTISYDAATKRATLHLDLVLEGFGPWSESIGVYVPPAPSSRLA